MELVISFEDALKATKDQKRALLIGNGFSADYFDYKSLLQESIFETGSPLRKLFSMLDTVDFEKVVHALESAAVVARAFGNSNYADQLIGNAKEVRKALVKAIQLTHPQYKVELLLSYASSVDFLSNFSNVFSLNYDLLLYWVNLEKRILQDGFKYGNAKGLLFGPFLEHAGCNLFNIHGGLHLFLNRHGDVMKAIHTGSGTLATIASIISDKGILPIFVAEGSSQEKMKKIKSNEYLLYCYRALEANNDVIFIYGHSAEEKDEHIYRAIFRSAAKHIYFGIHKPTANKIQAKDGLLAKYQKSSGSKIGYTFFNSESAKVWTSE